MEHEHGQPVVCCVMFGTGVESRQRGATWEEESREGEGGVLWQHAAWGVSEFLGWTIALADVKPWG